MAYTGCGSRLRGRDRHRYEALLALQDDLQVNVHCGSCKAAVQLITFLIRVSFESKWHVMLRGVFYVRRPLECMGKIRVWTAQMTKAILGYIELFVL